MMGTLGTHHALMERCEAVATELGLTSEREVKIDVARGFRWIDMLIRLSHWCLLVEVKSSVESAPSWIATTVNQVQSYERALAAGPWPLCLRSYVVSDEIDPAALPWLAAFGIRTVTVDEFAKALAWEARL